MCVVEGDRAARSNREVVRSVLREQRVCGEGFEVVDLIAKVYPLKRNAGTMIGRA
jgi:hypothetical protein